MTGTVYLGGGGGADDEAVLWRAMLTGRSRVVYWPFALPPAQAATAQDWLSGALAHLGLTADVDTWTDLGSRAPEQLASAELLLVGGGNTFQLLDHVRRHGFVEAVRDLVTAGGAYYGGSAGALLACADVELALRLDENEVGLSDLSALGLVDVDVLPHCTPDQLDDLREWSSRRGRPVLGVPERSGVALRGTTAEVLGHEPVWEVVSGSVGLRHPGEPWTCGAGSPPPVPR